MRNFHFWYHFSVKNGFLLCESVTTVGLSTNVCARLNIIEIWQMSNTTFPEDFDWGLLLRLNITIVILFFGEGHGKGPYDGSGGDWVVFYNKHAHRVIEFLQKLVERGDITQEEAEKIGLTHLEDFAKLANDPEEGFVKAKCPKKVKNEEGIPIFPFFFVFTFFGGGTIGIL